MNNLNCFSSLLYVFILENTKHYLANVKLSKSLQSVQPYQDSLAFGCAGFLSAFICQSCTLPIEVINNHVIVQGMYRHNMASPIPVDKIVVSNEVSYLDSRVK